MGLILGGVSASDLILDGQSVSLYVGGNPPIKVWPTRETVQITLGTGNQTYNQFRAALADRGLDYATITEIPFDIELVGRGMAQSMFSGCSALVSVPDMDTSQVTNMSYMFYGCSSLTSVPEMDTSSVTNMASMFYGCSSLTSVPDMDISNVLTTASMFSGCASLTSAPAMDTSNVTNMLKMFYNCTSLTTAPEMDTSKVTNMGDMFSECIALTYVPDMNTPQVTNMRGMFHRCSSLTLAPVLDTSQVVDSAYMFTHCASLIYVPYMDTSQNMDMYAMFMNCSSLTDGNVRLSVRRQGANILSMIATSGLTYAPFYAEVYEVSLTDARGRDTDHPLLTVTVPAGETWQVRIQGTMTKAGTSTSYRPRVRIGDATFGPYAQGEAVDCSGTVTSDNATIAIRTASTTTSNMSSFVGTVTIEKVVQITLGTDLEARDQLRAALTARGLDYTTVKGMPFGIKLVGSGSARELFRGCAALTSAPPMVTSAVTSMRSMFYDCSSLVRVPEMDTSRVTDMQSMFYNCAALTSVPQMGTAQVKSMYAMFMNCSSLTDGNVRLIGRHLNVNVSYMISGSGLTREPFYDAAGNPI